MDTLHNVIRSIKHETKSEAKSGIKSRADHLTVFREFLGHLDRAAKRARRAPAKRKSMKRSSKT